LLLAPLLRKPLVPTTPGMDKTYLSTTETCLPAAVVVELLKTASVVPIFLDVDGVGRWEQPVVCLKRLEEVPLLLVPPTGLKEIASNHAKLVPLVKLVLEQECQ